MSALRLYTPKECGPKGYPFAWAKGEPAVKDLVRELAGHRCVRCGHPYRCEENGKAEWSPCDLRCLHRGPYRFRDPAGGFEERGAGEDVNTAGNVLRLRPHSLVEAQWRILTVHHLIGVKADLRWWNLAALCQRCHLEIQGRVRMEQVYPHEHSEWFKPYAAGYYAATYLGEDLTREQTEARLDELLALERVA